MLSIECFRAGDVCSMFGEVCLNNSSLSSAISCNCSLLSSMAKNSLVTKQPFKTCGLVQSREDVETVRKSSWSVARFLEIYPEGKPQERVPLRLARLW